MSETRPIRYGIVGLGRAGWNIHVRHLRDRDDAVVAAVVDPEPERCAEAKAEFDCACYESLDELIADDSIDVVVVATPSHLHASDSIAAMRAGKDVVVEKPMALDLDEADTILSAWRETGKHLFVHQSRRFTNEYWHLKHVIDSGQIGRVYHIRAYMSRFARRNDWQTLRKFGGGLLNNHGSHFLDMLLQLIDSPVRDVWGDLKQVASAGDVEDHVKALLRGENGTTIDMEISTAQNIDPALPTWILCGTHGTLTCSGKESTIRWFDPDKVAPLEVDTGPAAGRSYTNDDKLPWQEETVPAKGPTRLSFYDNVTGVLRRGEAMHVTPESVRELIRVVAEIRRGSGFEEGAPATAAAR
ncbi:MAG: Gfo/Idh/MocA family oxidoreductase [Phycisphaeraceae bacterium]